MNKPADKRPGSKRTSTNASTAKKAKNSKAKSSHSASAAASGSAEKDKTRSRKVLPAIVVALCLFIFAPIVAFMVAYLVVDVPEADQLATKQISTIYAADNQSEIARIVPPEGNRVKVSIDEIPDSMKQAAISAEDRAFYSNPGFSIKGFARAVVGQLTGDLSKGGGSTITQQYVKIAVVGNEHSYVRKAKELVYAAKMANEWSKDQVLESYLNTIYLGRNTYGVASASQAYFGKDFKELTTEESALLAAFIQRPSSLDPWTNRPEAEARWNYVMDGMVEIGAIDAQERAAAVFPEVIDPNAAIPHAEVTGPNGLIKDRVLAELSDIGVSEQDLQTRGLKITTTIKPEAQDAAVKAVESTFEGEPENLRAAVVSIDPRTGAVAAYYGGADAAGWDYANAPLQTGSSFKIFTLAAALDQGIGLSTMYDSSPVTTGDVTVTNVAGESCGQCSIAEALKRSFNTSFIRLQRDLKNGPRDTAAMAHRLGVAESLPNLPHTLMEENGESYEGITLGQYQSRPLDMAVGLATIADGGVYHAPHFVTKVETLSGEVLYERQVDNGERRVSDEVANAVINAMRPIAAYSNGHALNGRESAAKTGTVQLGETGDNKDAWMIGATPQLATAVWVGTADNSALHNAWGGPIYGAGLPADIWKSTMDSALANEPAETFATAGQLGYIPPVAPAVTTSEESSESEAPGREILPGVTVPEPELPALPGIDELFPQNGGGQPAQPAPAQPAQPAPAQPVEPEPALPGGGAGDFEAVPAG